MFTVGIAATLGGSLGGGVEVGLRAKSKLHVASINDGDFAPVVDNQLNPPTVQQATYGLVTEYW